MAADWAKQDKGWYTSHLGGVAEEAPRKWFFYPRDNELVHGPFKSLREATAKAEILTVPASPATQSTNGTRETP